MGQKLGVKKTLKTVVTGVRYEGGLPREVEDPELVLPDGKPVPYVRYDVLYKHLGLPVRADAADGSAFRLVKGKVAHAMVRMRKMRGVSQREFCRVADVLVRGAVGFYFQIVYLTWAEAEKLEAIFRAAFNRFFGRAASSARVPLYAERPRGGRLRTHCWGVALASLYTVVTECISEPRASQQRMAARSAVAAALARWGCRTEPGRWNWAHLRAPLERSLGQGRVRYLGDAWMLAALVVAGGGGGGDDAAKIAELQHQVAQYRNCSSPGTSPHPNPHPNPHPHLKPSPNSNVNQVAQYRKINAELYTIAAQSSLQRSLQ